MLAGKVGLFLAHWNNFDWMFFGRDADAIIFQIRINKNRTLVVHMKDRRLSH